VALSAFDDPGVQPTSRTLQETLGRSWPAWTALTEALSGEAGGLQEVWAFAGPKFGWSLRLKRGKPVIVYLTPGRGYFLASFALGERACATALGADLPESIRTAIEEAPRYAEGRGVRIPVRSRTTVEAIRTLVSIKQGHVNPPRAGSAARRQSASTRPASRRSGG
jgi:hypothetical protein